MKGTTLKQNINKSYMSFTLRNIRGQHGFQLRFGLIIKPLHNFPKMLKGP